MLLKLFNYLLNFHHIVFKADKDPEKEELPEFLKEPVFEKDKVDILCII